MQEYESTWDWHLGKIATGKHRIAFVLLNATLIYSAPYQAGSNQRESECAEVSQMKKGGVAEPAITEWD